MNVVMKWALIMWATVGLARADVTVFAAASTTDAMKEIGALYTESAGEMVRFNFASSGALARQIDAGAPADLFLSANTKWMDYLESKARMDATTRSDLLANRLVLVEPLAGALERESVFEALLQCRRLAVGDFASVPAGAYAEQALAFGGVYDAVAGRLIKGDSVRRVLFYVERGEVDAGIVYATDAKISAKVKVVGVFPAESHRPICYPVALCPQATDAAADFLAFLKSPEAMAIFTKYGFETVK